MVIRDWGLRDWEIEGLIRYTDAFLNNPISQSPITNPYSPNTSAIAVQRYSIFASVMPATLIRPEPTI
jgi:hypothetical protein